jgi:AAHS family 4-hydroxybenzoate transporter-like MFS transporter
MSGGSTAVSDDPVSAVIDEAPIGRLHMRIFVMCALIMTLDGFDLGLLGIVVPAISGEWGLPASSFGFALSASLIGVAVGSAIAGWTGDRYGRRTTLIWMFVIGGIGSLLTALATDLTTLSVYRFITGIGMGGTIPSVIVLVNEFSPKRRRPFLVVLVYSAAALGSVGSSLLAKPLIERFGWESMFVVGGLLPLVIGVAAFYLLPESVRFLIARGGHDARAADMLQRLSGRPGYDPLLRAALSARSPAPKVGATTPSSALFAGWLRWATPLLWVAFIGTQALVLFIASWLPTLLNENGLSIDVAIRATGLYYVGSVVGGLIVSWFASRYPLSRLLALLYFAAMVGLLLLGSGVRGAVIAYLLAFFIGFTTVGASFCLGAFAATCYPDALRTRGVGWGLSVGRIGSIASPLLGGAALAAGLSVDGIISTLAFPAAVCCLAMVIIARMQTGAATHTAGFTRP